jgi:hypothetical protein
VKIVNGSYIAVPCDQTPIIKEQLQKLRVVAGWLVHQDAQTNVPVEQRAADPSLPPITYMSMSFTVQSLSQAQKDKAKG